MRKPVGVLILLFAVGVMMLCASPALGATLSWTGPTKYTDGTTIPSGDLSYQVYTGTSDVGPWSKAGSPVSGSTATVAEPPMGVTWWYTVTALSTAFGTESSKATPVSKTTPVVRTPNPPTNLQVY